MVKLEKEIEKLKADLQQAEEKLKEMTDAAKHALADLANFKRRIEEERKEFLSFGQIQLLKELLPIIDNFERATKTEQISAGINAIYTQFKSLFEKLGIKTIETVGQKFNANYHEAIMQSPGEKDVILEEIEKGYMLGEKVLRPAKVKVGNGGQSA